ncbi:carboxymuconolactone decarboxylase family protein [Rhizobium giardinii]|nr:carboxymuconolactone decarboxylase family protein [Rhizobium giardinii]
MHLIKLRASQINSCVFCIHLHKELRWLQPVCPPAFDDPCNV